MPAHVYAPYFETWTTDSITTIAQQSGARYFTLAFVEVADQGLLHPGLERRRQPRPWPSGRYLSRTSPACARSAAT